jgi:hypothetical protein
MEAHVDPRSEPTRTDDPPVVHEAAIGVNRRPGSRLAQQVDGAVVRGRLQVVEQPGLCQQQRPVQTDRTSSAYEDTCLIQSIRAVWCIPFRVP